MESLVCHIVSRRNLTIEISSDPTNTAEKCRKVLRNFFGMGSTCHPWLLRVRLKGQIGQLDNWRGERIVCIAQVLTTQRKFKHVITFFGLKARIKYFLYRSITEKMVMMLWHVIQ